MLCTYIHVYTHTYTHIDSFCLLPSPSLFLCYCFLIGFKPPATLSCRPSFSCSLLLPSPVATFLFLLLLCILLHSLVVLIQVACMLCICSICKYFFRLGKLVVVWSLLFEIQTCWLLIFPCSDYILRLKTSSSCLSFLSHNYSKCAHSPISIHLLNIFLLLLFSYL